MEDYEMRPTVAFPCVLLDVGQFTPSALSGNIQLMEGEVIVRLCFDAWSQTDSTAPAAWRDRGLAYYELEWRLNRALMGWRPDGFSALIRSSAATEKRDDNYRVREIRYSVQFEDRSAEAPRDFLGNLIDSDFNDDFAREDFGGSMPQLILS